MLDKCAVVIGGGIGGLTAAIALRRRGWRVTILERAPDFGEIGAGLTLMPNGVRSLEVLGLGSTVRLSGRVDGPGGTRTADGRWLARIDAEALRRMAGGSNIGIHRATLHRILRDAIPVEALVAGAEVVDVTPGPPAEVTFVRGTSRLVVRPDLVVGADGVNSVVRARLFPDVPPPVYQGTTAWRGVTRERWAGERATAISWGPGAEFGMVPLGDGRIYWYAAVNAPPGRHQPNEIALVHERFGRWHDPIPGLLAATDPSTVLRHDIVHLGTPLSSYVKGRIALLGDAAHAMTPNLGQGACQAIEDAVVLGALCGPDDDTDAALEAYDRQRRPRTQAMARAARIVGAFGQRLENPVAVALRNIIMRLMPPRAALRSMARYADWQPPAVPTRPTPATD